VHTGKDPADDVAIDALIAAREIGYACCRQA
jgi:hypothetical protein